MDLIQSERGLAARSPSLSRISRCHLLLSLPKHVRSCCFSQRTHSKCTHTQTHTHKHTLWMHCFPTSASARVAPQENPVHRQFTARGVWARPSDWASSSRMTAACPSWSTSSSTKRWAQRFVVLFVCLFLLQAGSKRKKPHKDSSSLQTCGVRTQPPFNELVTAAKQLKCFSASFTRVRLAAFLQNAFSTHGLPHRWAPCLRLNV